MDEKLGWRDERISRRHRLYGLGLPAVDIDFLLVEYNRSMPVALIDYKHYNTRVPDKMSSGVRALVMLADKYSDGPLPVVIAHYMADKPLWMYAMYPLNDTARNIFTRGQILDELEYVTWLYTLRGQVVPSDMYSRLVNEVDCVEQDTRAAIIS